MEELDLYLNLAKDYTKAVPEMSTWKFNNEQCKYLIEKVKVVVERANLFLEVTRSGDSGPHTFMDTTKWTEIFKLLLALAKQIESFIQGCCKDAWIEAAMTLTNVSEYVSSLGFNLELCRRVFDKEHTTFRCLTLNEVDNINKAEVEIVEKKALADVNTLIHNVISKMNSFRGESKDLASYLLQRLLRFEFNPTSDEESLWEVVVQQMKGLFNLVMPTQQLGRGASATVHRAMWLGTAVAKKTFSGSENSEFLKEVKILSQLFHPNITSMFCCAKNNRNCSIIMELMDGDLQRLIETRWKNASDFQPFPIWEAIDIMLQIGEGVHYLHNKRIIHRDLKTTNILFKSENATEKSKIGYMHIKVADFGLSKTKETSITQSSQTYNTGTNRWMAPEIINLNGGSQRNPARCHEILKYPYKVDIYSFGMICYEILTGCIPFSTSSDLNDIKRRVMIGERPSLPRHCPYKLKVLIEKCWNQEPKERPTLTEICAELKYLKYLLMIGYSLAKGEVEEHLRTSNWELSNTFMMHSGASWGIAINTSGNLVATASWGKSCRVYDIHLQKEVAVLVGHLDSLWAVKFSPSKQDLVGTVSTDYSCRLWNTNTKECLSVLHGHTNEVFGLSFKPRTNLLATASRDGTSMIWDVERGISMTTLKGHKYGVWNVCFEPNGGHLVATTSYDYTAKLWDLRSAQNVKTLTGHLDVVAGVDIEESGTYLATGSWDKTCRVWDLRRVGHDPIVVLQAHSDGVNRIAFSPYGKLLATTSKDRTVRLFNTTTWKCSQILSSHQHEVLDVAWSPAADFLLSASCDSGWKLWQRRVSSLHNSGFTVNNPQQYPTSQENSS